MATTFSSFDLNLLRVFDAIMEERSVLRASQKVFLSQSAVSHSLARLRELLDDELFIRTTTGMQPTARAIAMAPLVRDALRALESAIDSPIFEPATSSKRFTIAANDFTTMVIAPHLLRILKVEAPAVDLAIKPVTRIDLAEQLDLGRIDLALGTFSGLPDRFRSQSLFEYDDVLIARNALKLGPLSLDALARLPIVVVSFGGDQEGAIDGYLSERGLARRSEMYDRAAFEAAYAGSDQPPRIAVTLPHFLALPAFLEGATHAAIVPRPLGQSFARSLPIAVHELPYPTARLAVTALWHERYEGDASQSWLHEVVHRATEDLRSGADRASPRESRAARR
jgi:DNA-binding transcriptional LysR family regulator